uniref:Putative secreted protein n=1 Tax=Anopheles darlingi TaxID=43151 RepID=A0A2M4DLM5_ANODA
MGRCALFLVALLSFVRRSRRNRFICASERDVPRVSMRILKIPNPVRLHYILPTPRSRVLKHRSHLV